MAQTNDTNLCACGCGANTQRPEAKYSDDLCATVDAATGCWNFPITQSDGYARLWIGGNLVMVHRLSYTKHNGKIPEGLEIHHECRNRACVNPDHLEAITRIEHARKRKAA